jgi:long-subunit fatty acid transport protein
VIDFQQPCTLAAGIGYRFTDYFLVGLDCSWRNYAETLENLKIELSEGTGPDQTMIIPTRATNTFSVMLGAELKLTRNLTFRAGYCHDTKVSPDDRILYMAYMAGKGRTAAVGLGWQWDFYSVDIAWSRHFRDIAETGTSKFAPEFDNSVLEYGMDSWVLTVSKVF